MRLTRERFDQRFGWATAGKRISQEGVSGGGAGSAKSAMHGAMLNEGTPMSQTPKSFDEECAEYVARMAADEEVRQKTLDWINTTARHKYTYNFRWMGRPIIQFPQDLVAMQELVWSVRPDIIIETGIAHGGSLIFYASLLELLGGDGFVVGVDIDIRAHNRKAIEEHPMFGAFRLLQGSSVDPQVVNEVRELARGRQRVLVALDSNHTHEHVLAEMRGLCAVRDARQLPHRVRHHHRGYAGRQLPRPSVGQGQQSEDRGVGVPEDERPLRHRRDDLEQAPDHGGAGRVSQVCEGLTPSHRGSGPGRINSVRSHPLRAVRSLRCQGPR